MLPAENTNFESVLIISTALCKLHFQSLSQFAQYHAMRTGPHIISQCGEAIAAFMLGYQATLIRFIERLSEIGMHPEDLKN